MKTQLRNGSLRNLVISATLAASLNIAVSAQPNRDRNVTLSNLESLEIFAEEMEQSLKYIAPDDRYVNMETDRAADELELFTAYEDSKLKYTAPVTVEGQADQELEIYANQMIAEIAYQAPVYDEFTNTFSESTGMHARKVNVRHLYLDECTVQEAWLINSGYNRTSGKSLIYK